MEGWIDKASNQLQTAKDHLKSQYRYSESIEASQECVELSVKSILSLLNIEYPFSHDWDNKQLSKIAEQIKKKQILEKMKAQYFPSYLPRLLFLMNFWAQFYLTAKYGFQNEYLASAQDLFKKQEAELAIKHAEECYQAASTLRYLDQEKFNALVK